MNKPAIICNVCQTKTEWQLVDTEYCVNDVNIRLSGILAMKCPNCKTIYIPSKMAQAISENLDAIAKVNEELKKSA